MEIGKPQMAIGPSPIYQPMATMMATATTKYKSKSTTIPMADGRCNDDIVAVCSLNSEF